jgi:HEAT repeat protein
MAKVDRVDRLVSELAEIRKQGRTDAGLARVLVALRDKDSYVVSRAIDIADAWGADSLAEDVVKAFERFVTSADPGCAVKERAAKALCEWGSPHGKSVFERGVSLVQMEAVWGKSEDVAAGVRGWSALGLAAMGHWDQVRLILPLLADPERHARILGARALAQGASDAAEALLRLKILLGDAEEEVTAECLTGLATAWPDRSVEFLRKLSEGTGRCAAAALQALGASRSADAFRALVDMYLADLSPTRRQEILNALATSRREEALAWLIDLIENGSPGEAVTAIDALAPRKSDDRIWSRVRAAVEAGGNPRIEEALRRAEESPKC